MPQPLHELPNGAWIDLGEVTAIDPMILGEHMQVRICCGPVYRFMTFSTIPHARAYAAELARLVNVARMPPQADVDEKGTAP